MSPILIQRHLILDAGIFRRATHRGTSAEQAAPILKEINNRRPLVILGLTGSLPKYLGMNRSQWSLDTKDVANRFKEIRVKDIETLNQLTGELYEELAAYYQGLLLTDPYDLVARIKDRLSHHTSPIPQARQLAHDVLYSVGDDLSEGDRTNEVASFHALDELFYHARTILPSGGDIRWGYFFACLNICQEYRQHSFYRLFESLLFALKLTNKFGIKDPSRSKHLNEIESELSILSPDEADDGLWLWQAFQGNVTDEKAVPVTVLTMDKKCAARAAALWSLLNERYDDTPIVEIITHRVKFVPGEIVLYDSNPLQYSQLIDISTVMRGPSHP